MSIGVVTVELELRDGDFTLRARNAENVIRQLGATASQTSTGFNTLSTAQSSLLPKMRDMTVIAYGLIGAFSTLKGTVGELGIQIIKANSEMERMRVLLGGLSHASTKEGQIAEANRDLTALYSIAQKAPFALLELSNAFVKMKAVGLTDVEGKLKSLTNAIASFGGDNTTLHRATVAIQQMASKGVISMEELRQQMGEAVPDAIAAMAFGMGKSTSVLIAEISKGTVAAVPAINAMLRELERRHSDSAAIMMQTWIGLTSQLHTKWTIFLNKLGEGGLFDEAKKQLADLGKALDSKEAIKFGKSVGEMLNTFIVDGRKAIDIMYEWGAEIKSAAQDIAIFYASIKVFEFGKYIATQYLLAQAAIVSFRTMMGASQIAQVTTTAIPAGVQMLQGMGNAGAIASQTAAIRAQQAAMLAGYGPSQQAMIRNMNSVYRALTAELIALNAGVTVVTAATVTNVAAVGRMTAAWTIFKATVGGMPGVIGLVITALSLGVLAWQTWGTTAETAIDKIIRKKGELSNKDTNVFNTASEEDIAVSDKSNEEKLKRIKELNRLVTAAKRTNPNLQDNADNPTFYSQGRGGKVEKEISGVSELREMKMLTEETLKYAEAKKSRRIVIEKEEVDAVVALMSTELDHLTQYDSQKVKVERDTEDKRYEAAKIGNTNIKQLNIDHEKRMTDIKKADDDRAIESAKAQIESYVKMSNKLAADILGTKDIDKKSNLETKFKAYEIQIGLSQEKLDKFKASLKDIEAVSDLETAGNKKSTQKRESINDSVSMQIELLNERNNDVLPMVKQLIRLQETKKDTSIGSMDAYNQSEAALKQKIGQNVRLEAEAEIKKLQEKIDHANNKSSGETVTASQVTQLNEELTKLKTTLANTIAKMSELGITVETTTKKVTTYDVPTKFAMSHKSELIDSIIQVESGKRANVTSSAGAVGYGQIIPSTGRDPGYGIPPLKGSSLEDTKQFIGDWIDVMLKKFGTLEGAIRSYNAGPKNWENQTNIGPQNRAYFPSVMKEFTERTKTQGQFTSQKEVIDRKAGLGVDLSPLESGISKADATYNLQEVVKSHTQLTQEIAKFHRQSLDAELTLSKDKTAVYRRETEFLIEEIKTRKDSAGKSVFSPEDQGRIGNQISGEREVRQVIEQHGILKTETGKLEKAAAIAKANLKINERDKQLALLAIEEKDYSDSLTEQLGYDEAYHANMKVIDAKYQTSRQDLINENLPQAALHQQLDALETQKEAEVKYAQETATLSEAALAGQAVSLQKFAAQRELILQKTGGAWGTLKDQVIRDSDDIYGKVGVSMANGVADGFATMAVTGKMHFADLARSVIGMAAKMIIQLLILKAIQTAVGMFMGGGVSTANGNSAEFSTAINNPGFPAEMESGGVISVRSFAKGGDMSEQTAKYLSQAPVMRHQDMTAGGIKTRPHVALFGEGAMPEAFIPMIDHKSIPVTMGANGLAYVQVPSGEKIPVTLKGGMLGEPKKFLNGGAMGVTKAFNDFKTTVETQGNNINVSVFPSISIDASGLPSNGNSAHQNALGASNNVVINMNIASGAESSDTKDANGQKGSDVTNTPEVWQKISEKMKTLIQQELVTQSRPGGMMWKPA